MLGVWVERAQVLLETGGVHEATVAPWDLAEVLSGCASLLVLEPSAAVVKLLVTVAADLAAFSKQNER